MDRLDVPQAGERCAWQVLEGEAVIIDLVTRRVMGLNPTASLLWSGMDGRRTVAEIAAQVAQRFGQVPEAVERDALHFFGALAGRGLVRLAAGASRRSP